jgi:NADPH-dependent glutamate synthase beta subunit-like oxidoreductase/formate hydrogenlyase subunit 6/NADH:ubiquinone oxidoreductase subunit I/ferredoxin
MREATRPASQSSPPAAPPAKRRKADWTPVETDSTAVSINPIAPASAALTERAQSAAKTLRRLHPAANQKAVWNRRAGRPDSRPDAKTPYDTVVPLDDSPGECLITAQAPQRPLSTPTFQMEIDGRTVNGTEGQTILEVCRANGIEVPTLCYEPKLPGFGACRMCVVEIEGEAQPAISCSRAAEAGTVVRTQTEQLRRIRRTNLELIFSDHNAYCLPPCQNKCPSHIDIPGFLKANAEGQFRESARIFKRSIPFPSILGRVCPAPCEDHCRRDEVEEAIAIRDSHRYAGDFVLREQKGGIEPPLPFETEPKSGKRVAVIGSGPAGMAAAYYLLLSGHDVTVFERDPQPGGMLRYGIPEYRLPKVGVLEPEYEAVWRLGARLVCNQALGRDFNLDDLCAQGFDATIVATGCYDTNKLNIPNETADGVIDGLEYLRIATLGLPYPGHKKSRVVVIGGGFTAMDCWRTSIRQGARAVTIVYRRDMKDMPAASEVHEALEEGGTAIFQAGPTRVIVDANNKVTGVEFIRMRPGAPDASGRRRPEPAAGTEFVVECNRVLLAIGQGPDLSWIGPGNEGVAAVKYRLNADAVTFETGRSGVFGSGDVRIGSSTVVQAVAEGRRCAYAVDAYLRGEDLGELRTRQTLAEVEPTFLSIVPYTDEPKEARHRLTSMPGKERSKSYVEYEIGYTAAEVMAESTRCLQCTCEAVGNCDLRRLGIEYGTTLATLEPGHDRGAGFRSVTENRFTGANHDYIRDDSHAFILREPSRCIDCGRCAAVCAEVVGAACYDFMRFGFDTLVTTPLDMSLNDTPCVSCGRCAETCPTGALMPKPRILDKYDVDESRCILCGICVDACPYDALRGGQDNELAHVGRGNPEIDLIALAEVDRETEVTYIRRERDWLAHATAEGRVHDPAEALPALPPSLAGAPGKRNEGSRQ